MSRRPTCREHGSASLFVLAFLALLLLLGAASGVVAALVRAHRTAQAAADLAALAAAAAAARGGDACTTGAQIAAANDARLTRCELVGRDATVRVTVTGPRWLGQVGDLGAEARAGPG